MKSMTIVACLVQALLLQVSGQVYYKKFVRNSNGKCEILNDSQILKYANLKDDKDIKIIQNNAETYVYGDPIKKDFTGYIFETYSKNMKASQDHLDTKCSKGIIVAAEVDSLVANEDCKIVKGDSLDGNKVCKIVYSGDPTNRIDVVFMGDGYTANERTRFFDDVKRLKKDIFEGDTFKSWLPLFNIWAIHVPSIESGIGYKGPKKTPFKLFRETGQLRAIYSGNSPAARSICKLTGANACDYPSLLANDDFYGGLGGEFVISTRSERTGTIVLNHEMGHNFVDVGEEYDRGYIYKGVNSADSLEAVGWSSWLSKPSSEPLREERAIYRLLENPWHDLSQGDKSFTFTSDGKYNRWYLSAVVSAAGEADSLEFLLDKKPLLWQTRGSDDRESYVWKGDIGFLEGEHTLTVRSKTTPTNRDIPRMISSVTLYEYGNEKEFNASNDNYSAYPTWDINGRKTYRPTNAGCLMRNVTFTHFCNVCKEGMWHQFLAKISLIDGVSVSNGQATVSPLKLGQLRPDKQKILGEKLEINWFKSNQLQSELNDQLTIPVTTGSWSVQVKLMTPEVRNDPKNLLTDTKVFTV